MLKRNATVIGSTMEGQVVTGSSVLHDGSVLTRVLVSGKEKVKPSEGLKTDVFIGFSYNLNANPINASKVELVTVPATSPRSITLAKTNTLVGQILIRKVSGGTVLDEVSANPGAGEYAVDEATGIILFNVAEAGVAIQVVYRYTVSAADLYYRYSHTDPNRDALYDMFQAVGVITEGDVFTDQFNAGIDWNNVISVNMAAGGLVTGDGAGEEIPNARVIHSPTSDNPFLGVSVLNIGYGSESSFSSSSVSSSSMSSVSSSSSSSSISSSSSSSSSSISSSSSSSSISSVSSSSA